MARSSRNSTSAALDSISGQRKDQKCATLRASPRSNTLPLQPGGEGRTFRVGLEFVEEGFLSRHTPRGGMHFYHFMEFWVVAFAELTQLSNVGGGAFPTTSKSGAKAQHVITNTTSIQNTVEVPWIFVPRIPQKHICGTLQCLLSSFLFPLSPEESTDQHHSTTTAAPSMEFFGSEVLDDLDLAEYLLESVDATLVINRARCNHGIIHKMYANYILGSFDAQQWSQQVQKGILKLQQQQQQTTNKARKDRRRSQSPVLAAGILPIDGESAVGRHQQPTKLVITYIDRQRSFRRLLPWDHRWIMKTFSRMSNTIFLRVKMEDYSGPDQLMIDSVTDVFIGMHGNGLSHQMFAKPGGAVIEIFWNKNYHYDYYTMALLMEHDYLCVYSGQVIEYFPPRNKTYEEALWPLPAPPGTTDLFRSFSDKAKDAITDMVAKTRARLKITEASR
jgi:hypothetical protein